MGLYIATLPSSIDPPTVQSMEGRKEKVEVYEAAMAHTLCTLATVVVILIILTVAREGRKVEVYEASGHGKNEETLLRMTPLSVCR